MEINESLTLIEILAATYPNHRQFSDSDQILKTAKIWASLLEDIPVKLAVKAVEKHCMLSKFPPSIAEIRERATEIMNPETEITAADAWGYVMKAIRGYGSCREHEALDSLPEIVKKVVTIIGWKDICLSEEPDIIRAQFRMAFEKIAKSDKETKSLPKAFKKQIEGLAEGLKTLDEASITGKRGVTP
ncbi:MAG: replicative helicase loader/inhibitor [Candidatus Paceibacterota bacterium]|jgi:hypothetical protein